MSSFILRLARFVLDLLHAHGDSPQSPVGYAGSFRSLSGLISFRPSANPPNALTRLSPCARSVNPVKTNKREDRF